MAADEFQYFDAVEAGHEQIEEHDRRFHGCDHLHAFQPVGRPLDPVTGVQEPLLVSCGYDPVVLNDENCFHALRGLMQQTLKS